MVVWWARSEDVDAEPRRLGRALAWLSPAERVRHDRFRSDADRRMFLAGRVMARALVGRALGVAPTGWTWREGPRGRPEIGAPGAPLVFNLAHSGGLVACALSRGAAVGVDVEHRSRAHLDPRLVDRCCAPEEIDDVRRAGPDGWRDQFLKYWTLKEAYLKARGLGISVPLADLCFQLSPEPRLACRRALAGEPADWAFRLDRVTDGHWLAAAAPLEHTPPHFIVAPFPEELWA